MFKIKHLRYVSTKSIEVKKGLSLVFLKIKFEIKVNS